MGRVAEAKRVIFIPWPEVDGALFKTATEAVLTDESGEDVKAQDFLKNLVEWRKLGSDSTKWKANRPNKHIHVKHFNGNTDTVIPLLSNFDVIYVQGHGAAGADKIFPSRNADFKVENSSLGLPFNLVCDRLIASGMQEKWSGDLKFNICESADAGSGRAFAALCSEYLHGKRFTCRVWGYSGEVDSAPKSAAKRTVTLSDNTDHRASEQRFRHFEGKRV